MAWPYRITVPPRSSQAGFTIIELMISISVLSMVLLLTTMGIVRIGEGYYKGITQANTQQAARSVMDGVAQNIQFNGADPTFSVIATAPSGIAVQSMCIGKQRYSFTLGNQQTDSTSSAASKSRHTLWKDDLTGSGCTPLDVGTATPSIFGSSSDGGVGGSGRELLGSNMRLTNFEVASSGSSSLYTVAVTVMYGDDDLIIKGAVGAPMKDWTCKSRSGLIGASFCAQSELVTTVGKRLR